MIILKKNDMELKINELGAEVKSFTINQEEFLWNKEQYWNKTSPILFPLVGALRNGKYIYKDKEYSITTRHGFARDNVFEVLEKKEDYVKLSFKYNEETLEKYPFKFILNLIYTLTDNGFNIDYEVKNLENDDMYFSIGAHPAFVLDDNYEENNYLEFEFEENEKRYSLHESNFFHGKEEFFEKLENRKIIPILDDKYFNKDAIAFKNLKSNIVYLRNKKNSKEVKVDYTNFPYIAFWKVKDAPFVCIEPWYGINDMVLGSYNLTEKEGIEKLEKNSTFKAQLKFEFKKGN